MLLLLPFQRFSIHSGADAIRLAETHMQVVPGSVAYKGTGGRDGQVRGLQ